MRWRAAIRWLATTGLLVGCSRHKAPEPVIMDATAAAGDGAVATLTTATPKERPELALVYSSDSQGADNLARRATLIDEARREARSLVIVDGGDFLPSEGDDAGTLDQRAHVVLASYKRMGVDAVVPGERELSLGIERMRKMLSDAHVPAVAANLTNVKGAPAFDATHLVEGGPVPVGIFGIVELPSESRSILEKAGLTAGDPIEAARAAVQSLREHGARFIVGLFHVSGGAGRAEEIVRGAAGVDVVVLGHASEADVRAVPAGATRILYAGALGTHLGRLDIRASDDAGDLTSSDRKLPVGPNVREHLGVGLLPQIDGERAKIAQQTAAAAERRKKGLKEEEPNETWTYGSTAACALCHQEVVAQWKTTDHAHAMATLKKAKHETDPACIGCHMTGYLQPGGTRTLKIAVEQFSEVGCESCHGPSALHVRSRDKKKGTSRQVPASVCLGCHTPDQNLGTFDYEASLPAIFGPGHSPPQGGPKASPE